MSTSLTSIKDQLIKNVVHQRTPFTYTDAIYKNLTLLGCKRFYMDSGIENSWSDEYTAGDTPSLSRTLTILEQEYCIKSSEIEFLKKVRAYWNTMIGYTTNALSIKMVDKPFKFLTETIKELEVDLVGLFHKMTDVSNPSSIGNIDVDAVDYTYD